MRRVERTQFWHDLSNSKLHMSRVTLVGELCHREAVDNFPVTFGSRACYPSKIAKVNQPGPGELCHIKNKQSEAWSVAPGRTCHITIVVPACEWSCQGVRGLPASVQRGGIHAVAVYWSVAHVVQSASAALAH